MRASCWLVVAIFVEVAGCVGDGFLCDDDAQCSFAGVSGRCEATRACSFPDATCASGWRYGALSEGRLAKQCVDAEVGDDAGASSDFATTPGDLDGTPGDLGTLPPADLAAPPADMAMASCTIAFKAATTTEVPSSGSMSIVLSRPTGTTTGDLLLAAMFWGSTNNSTLPSMTAPTGWTLLRRTDNSPEASLSVYYKIATASEPSSYTFDTSTGMSAAGWIAAYSGVNQTTPIDTDKGQFANTSSTTYAAPSITTSYANDVVLFTVGAFDQGTSGDTWNGPLTQRKQINNNNAKSIVFGDATQAAPGASAAASATASFSQNYALLEQLALRCQ
jgi:hypothetical protein